MSVIHQIYKLRGDFILIGLTGRTGSGCSSVANILSTKNFSELKTEFREINTEPWDNDSRKNRIVHNYMQRHWHPFFVIRARNVILFYALQLEFDAFLDQFDLVKLKLSDSKDEEVRKCVFDLKEDYQILHERVLQCEKIISEKKDPSDQEVDLCIDVLSTEISAFRERLLDVLKNTKLRIINRLLQKWGNNIRRYDSICQLTDDDISEHAPACLARKINQFIKLIRRRNRKNKEYTHIVIDALRNPYEVLFFRERYSAFYLMSINTEEKNRRDQLIEKGFDLKTIEELDSAEGGKTEFNNSYQEIDIDKCIELSDIFVTHDGSNYKENRGLNNQIITYISLIRHPGLILPSPTERIMQIAYTAKLNSGCLSRQIGAVVTNKNYSIQSIGWNTVAQGQTPCSLRCIDDLREGEDDIAYSEFEKKDSKFSSAIQNLNDAYIGPLATGDLIGLPTAFCFKDIYTTITPNQENNQIHTRALFAEENAFLQLAKYGTEGIKGGKLFTTSSCSELCAKKAYQLGIEEIIYIDSNPGITQQHIIECGNMRPKMVLFHGAIGRAYSSLYNPFIPYKAELEALSGISVKAVLKPDVNKKEKKS